MSEINNQASLGIDIGSTTIKVVLLDADKNILYSEYRRHHANIKETLTDLIKGARETAGNVSVHPMITGSGGLALATHLGVPFNQEVIAVSTALTEFAPQTDVAIELGGEDAKIIYFEDGNVEQRMNGICAGGTGSFIDQMASLLQTDATGLNEYAKSYKSLYTIAARCGVFAKTDIQPLINEGATREDLSASIFQAVVNQTIGGLACGKPIRGHVAFLGGPLHFLDQLKEAFIRTLKLDDEHIVDTDNSHLFAAIGCALNSDPKVTFTLDEMADKLSSDIKLEFEVRRLDPLFENKEAFEAFESRHAQAKVVKEDLKNYKGNVFFGIDAGSTTTKIALVGEDGSLLYSFYSGNNGSPLKTAIAAITDIKNILPEGAKIVRSCSTGYGEALLKSAFMLDDGEVETIAHYKAAAFFDPGVDCILDIGGQDMKCIKIKNGAVESVQLNEACSSGCGSFIETFAKSLDYSVKDFAQEALFAAHPIDLGTRCTVFMNSRVKQAQKEGASVADISAGLAYSVIKNALFKVIKVSSASELGKNIVVQGGTFYNNAVLRAFEKIADCEAIRPDIAGIMGAFGCALIARERYEEGYQTTMLSLDDIIGLQFQTSMAKCKGCTNSCRLTINRFSGGRQFISGNRCERGIGGKKNPTGVPNLVEYKLNRLFDYESLPEKDAVRGSVGLPRVLNMYENYPFWHTFFTQLKYRVIVSPVSTRSIFEMGIESIPSESICYPAKLAHGHIAWLIKQNPDMIFYPSVFMERKEDETSFNNYNCPVVGSNTENIKNNVEDITAGKVKYRNPFMSFKSEASIAQVLVPEFSDIPEKEVKAAIHKAWEEQARARKDIQKKGEETLKYLKDTGKHGIVLAGRPYHIDPEINHGIPELITSYDMAVLTEDSISHLATPDRPLIVADQWTYHSRLYAAATYVKGCDNLDLIQLNSFGCGLDAVTVDQMNDILSGSDKIYTVLKIDEVNNLGAARIRVRSLISALKERERTGKHATRRDGSYHRVEFTKEMKKNYTILCPQLSPMHFDMFETAFQACGYDFVCMGNADKAAIDLGLKYINNDACYPSIIMTGQLIQALKSGKYDVNKTAIIMSQTGGCCRATNYIAFIRRALKKAGLEQVPVISLSAGGIEENSGFKVDVSLLIRMAAAFVYGDLFIKCMYRMRPYELEKGSCQKLHDKWLEKCRKQIMQHPFNWAAFNSNCRNIVKEFDAVPIDENLVKPKVGMVGEILMKFLPAGNNFMVEQLESEGCEAVVPGFVDFIQFFLYNRIYKSDHYGMPKKKKIAGRAGIWAVDHILRGSGQKALKKSKHFTPATNIYDIADLASQIVSLGNQAGEGWLLTGEMMELIHSGVPNLVVVQPFGCLPNHVVGKGPIKAVRAANPGCNIVAIDFDPGASEVNQVNRLKLMLSTAFKKLNKDKENE